MIGLIVEHLASTPAAAAAAGAETSMLRRNQQPRLYAEHLSCASQASFDPDPIQVNEPGRSLRIGWEYRL
jgi:hypothetical protein